uniref:Uncharacterized protein n=1 Tax=Arundo donax TaxID=35708 RepID=A0A0A8YR01_ARUDO
MAWKCTILPGSPCILK